MKKLIAIILVVLITLSMTACTTKRQSETVKGEASRMIEIENTSTYCIVYDKYTKVMYAISDGAYNYGTFTLLVDANGKPLLYEEQTERNE